MSEQLADGWYRLKSPGKVEIVSQIVCGCLSGGVGLHVSYWTKNDWQLEPVVVLTTTEHAALVQEAADDAAEAKHYRAMVVQLEDEVKQLRPQVAWKESVIH